MADKTEDRNRCSFAVEARVSPDGDVSGRVIGVMPSHRKEADGSDTHVSTSVEFDEEDAHAVGAALYRILEKHRVRLEARAYDERSMARARARMNGEIAGEVRQ